MECMATRCQTLPRRALSQHEQDVAITLARSFRIPPLGCTLATIVFKSQLKREAVARQQSAKGPSLSVRSERWNIASAIGG